MMKELTQTAEGEDVFEALMTKLIEMPPRKVNEYLHIFIHDWIESGTMSNLAWSLGVSRSIQKLEGLNHSQLLFTNYFA